MATAKMTLLAMYDWDNTLFDGLTLPEGLVKDVLVDEILLKAAEFEIVYPDPVFLKSAITHWGLKNNRTFSKWVEALSIEFDPLYNYDRFEEYEDSRNRIDSRSHSDTRNSSDTRSTTDNATSVSNTETSTKDDTTNTKSVSAYDASTYQPKEQEVIDHDTTVGGVGSAVSSNESNASGSASESGSGSENGTENEVTKHTAHLYGNIGVTTSTQMLEDFLRVERFNIYEQIADIFITEFCVLVYE